MNCKQILIGLALLTTTGCGIIAGNSGETGKYALVSTPVNGSVQTLLTDTQTGKLWTYTQGGFEPVSVRGLWTLVQREDGQVVHEPERIRARPIQ